MLGANEVVCLLMGVGVLLVAPVVTWLLHLLATRKARWCVCTC